MLHNDDDDNAHSKAIAHQWLDDRGDYAARHKLKEHSHHKWQAYGHTIGKATHRRGRVQHLEAGGKLRTHQEEEDDADNLIGDVRKHPYKLGREGAELRKW